MTVSACDCVTVSACDCVTVSACDYVCLQVEEVRHALGKLAERLETTVLEINEQVGRQRVWREE